jgi:hypothetical protein
MCLILVHDLLNFDIISDILKWKVIQLLVNIEEFELMIRHRLRAVPPFRGFRFPGRKGGTADNTSRNEIRVAHTTQNSHWSKSIRLSIKSDM